MMIEKDQVTTVSHILSISRHKFLSNLPNSLSFFSYRHAVSAGGSPAPLQSQKCGFASGETLDKPRTLGV
jgi:hypothetical protein